MDNDFRMRLEGFYSKEVADKDKYLKFADELEEAGYGHAAVTMRDISAQERTHSILIKDIIQKYF